MDRQNKLTDDAAQALDAFAKGAGADAASALADVFDIAGNRIAESLERAAQMGALSFDDLAESILSDFARLAISELVTAPLEGVVSALTSSISGGATASKSSPVTVNLNMAAEVGKSFAPQPSSAQIATQVARAVARAQPRN